MKDVSYYTNPFEVLGDPDFSVVDHRVILDVVVVHVHAGLFLHLLTLTVLELESALQFKSHISSYVGQNLKSKCLLDHFTLLAEKVGWLVGWLEMMRRATCLPL